MDLGLFDDVVDRRSLVPQDRECFYQMLAAASRADPEDLVKRTRGKYGLAPLITEYDSHRGNLVALTVGARRAVKIPIIEDDLRERFGLTHYYEINGFVDERVRVKRDQNDVEGTVYNRYPIVFCVVELPDGMPVGDDINETIRVPAFSFKMVRIQNRLHIRGRATPPSAEPPVDWPPADMDPVPADLQSLSGPNRRRAVCRSAGRSFVRIVAIQPGRRRVSAFDSCATIRARR